jgi:hypothetical protein
VATGIAVYLVALRILGVVKFKDVIAAVRERA